MPALARAIRKAVSIVATDRARRVFLTGTPTVAGKSVGPESSLQAVAVYASVRLIAQTIMSLPVTFILTGDKTRTPQQPPAVRAFWDDPNADQDLASFYETLVLSLMLWGNIYAFPRRSNGGDVIEVWPIDPERITAIKRLTAEDGRVGLAYQVAGFEDEEHPNGWVLNGPDAPPNMLHIPLMTLPGRIKGLSPIAQAAEQIGMTLSAGEHAARFLGEGVHMSGTIETPEPLSEDDAKELWANFQKVHAGPAKSAGVGILTGGAKFNVLTIPPAELQFLEQMKYGDRKIATLYGVPPHMVGDVERSTSWGTGIEEQTKGFLQYTLVPILKKIEKGVDKAFLQGTDLHMKFVVNGLLRGAPKDRAAFYWQMYQMGAFSSNDIRELEDMPPLAEGGDTYVRPLNMEDITASAAAEDGDPIVPVKERVESATALVRAGYSPTDALVTVGLDPMLHLGLLPVTLQGAKPPPPADDADDEDES